MNENEVLVSLDIGTSRIKVIIGEIMNDSLNIIGVGSAKSNGMKKGAIVDIDQTVQSIKSAVEQAERMVDMKIERVVVGVNGNHVQLQPCHGVVAVSAENREIGDEDIARVIDAAQVVSVPPEREIVDVIPEQFIVDGQDEITDPRGMIGVRLEMEGMIITCARTVLHNTLKCVERAGLEVLDVCLQPLAAGTVSLSNDETNLGVALVDVGGGSTTVSIFEEGYLKGTSLLPYGGDNITKDLSIGLRTSTEEAENIKLEYGHAFFDDASEEETFSVTIIGSNRQQSFNQLQISDMIEARLEEIFVFAAKELQRMGVQDLPGGFVLTGGAMNMPGVLELAQDVFHSNVRLAIPDYLGVREPQYTSGVGILQFAYRNAKIQGKELFPAVSTQYDQPAPQKQKRVSKQQSKEQNSKPKEKKESGFSNLLKYFFD
ncbi:cell division protein FtsA [Halobacillus andaensis]|uniref:Cell division protein FtsA n=1 Tax=Halobacillus andaensis TaxID=1176239 RepID=A0A917B1F1_HALAA|nr:cell division protein FtsA [Halobacillus andaensis]MBP2003578.1 cell division protein FtsA [Halobacillus andaensis]GGF11697.1 cell division protein FtsA [Halobacillus andaensis]